MTARLPASAAPEGLAAVEQATEGREVTIVLGALDEQAQRGRLHRARTAATRATACVSGRPAHSGRQLAVAIGRLGEWRQVVIHAE